MPNQPTTSELTISLTPDRVVSSTDRIMAKIGRETIVFAPTDDPNVWRENNTRVPIVLPLLPPSSPRLRQRSVAAPVPLDREKTLESLMGARETWAGMIRTAYSNSRAYVTLAHVLADLRATFEKHRPLGLAAPQVGIGLRIILARPSGDDAPTMIINPKIIAKDGQRRGKEFCLSLPGVKREVRRASNVEVEGMGERGEEVRIKAHGLYAAVIQHEIDHLDGILMTSR